MSIGATYVRCDRCHVPMELGDDCPTCAGLPEPTNVVELVDRIDDHAFERRNPLFCVYCGVHLSEATVKRCGPS